MRRRDFLASAGAAALACGLTRTTVAHPHHDHECGPLYATPEEAMQSERETLAFLPAIRVGTKVNRPDYLAVVDLDPHSKTYSQVIQRLEMPNVGDELHHFGWNACSSCHGQPGKARRFLVLPGVRSTRIHIVDVENPRRPKLYKVIEPDEIKRKTNLSAPHTVHCLADGRIMLSMLGDAKGDAPGGFLLLDENFDIVGRWEKNGAGMNFNYDFWYQPRHNVMVSSEWGAPNTVKHGFKLEDVQAGKYGHSLQFWDWEKREIAKTFDLGEAGMIPLEVRFHHNPDSTHGFVGAALSSALWHWRQKDGQWHVEKVAQVEPVETEGWPFPVPGLITDLLVSMDDRWLYLSNWLHGDIRQYDISNPDKPRLTAQAWLGGVIGKKAKLRDKELIGGPQMLQLSLDGRRLYVTNSLFSSWDNQFYPAIAERGSHMLQLDVDSVNGGLTLNEDFYVDFGNEPHGPARAHEVRFPGGDSTSEIWV